MRCKSCGADTPPEFKHCIQNNICASCGDALMSDEDKSLLDELTLAIEKMHLDPKGLAFWLMSNYIFEKIGDAKPIEKFYNKSGTKHQNDDDGIDRENLKIAQSPTEGFLKRTDQYNQIKRTQANLNRMAQGSSKIAEMARTIQGVEDPYGDEEKPVKNKEVEEVADLNKEDLAAYKELLKMGGNPFVEVDPSAIRPALNAGELSDDVDDGKPTAIELELSKSDKGREVLRNQRIKRIQAQESLHGGGIIRRSS